MKDIEFKLNIKSIMLFEQLTGKSFYEMGPDDIITMIYSIVVVNNPKYKMNINEFVDILQNKKIAKELIKDTEEELDFIRTVIPYKEEENKDKTNKGKHYSTPKITDIATNLIVLYGLDINYVMYDMQIWELVPFASATEVKIKNSMENQRFWTYLQILPHIDGKKCKGPQHLIPFPWEKEEKKEVDKEFLTENNDRIMNLFNKNKEKDKDGK